MKKSYLLYISVLFFAVFLACNKDVTEKFADLEALAPINQDTTASVWRTILLVSAADIAVPEPKSVASPEYIQELADTRQKNQNLSDTERAAIGYWGAGSTLRWNQIMRALVAKYNLPVAPSADGTYIIPNADSTKNNPFYYPVFPFSNPPYAARAYAYVSVAQFDALIAAWHFKKQYKRTATWRNDPAISPSLPKNELYTYPCEDAVLAGATVEILKALFPGEKAFLEAKATEAAWFKQWAGLAVASDVNAGLELGKGVAAKALARAKTDGMKNAVGNQHLWDSLAQRIVAQNEVPWHSLDAPARPPMLPFFGKVQPWLFASSELANIRPAQPPRTDSPEFKAELEAVKAAADPNDREKMRIVHFWADGAGTSTPPGHWNALAFEQVYNAKFSEPRAARAFALLNMALMDAAVSCWETKYFYYLPRPTQMDASIKTLTGIPNFPAYTSGHSTFSAAAATILGHIFPAQAATYESMAKEASLSRLYGGIHYPMDCDKGLETGKKVGTYAVQRAMMDGGE